MAAVQQQRVFGVVGGIDYGVARFGQIGHQAEDGGGVAVVKGGSGFVKQNHSRLLGQGAGDVGELFFAAAGFHVDFLRQTGDAQFLQRGFGHGVIGFGGLGIQR